MEFLLTIRVCLSEKKDKFVTRIAEALEMSTPNVRRKIYRGTWKGYELKFVDDIINS